MTEAKSSDINLYKGQIKPFIENNYIPLEGSYVSTALIFDHFCHSKGLTIKHDAGGKTASAVRGFCKFLKEEGFQTERVDIGTVLINYENPIPLKTTFFTKKKMNKIRSGPIKKPTKSKSTSNIGDSNVTNSSPVTLNINL